MAVHQGIHPQDLQGHLYNILLLRAAARVVQAEAAAALPIQAAAEAAAAVHHIQAAAEAAVQAAQEGTAAEAAAVVQGHLVVHHPLHHTVAAEEAGDNIYK